MTKLRATPAYTNPLAKQIKASVDAAKAETVEQKREAARIAKAKAKALALAAAQKKAVDDGNFEYARMNYYTLADFNEESAQRAADPHGYIMPIHSEWPTKAQFKSLSDAQRADRTNPVRFS